MQFRLSDLLWLMFAAAIVAGLWVRQHRPAVEPEMDMPRIMTVEVHVPERVEPATAITWDDLHLGLERDVVVDPQQVKESIRNLAGQRVQIAGVICGVGLTSLQIDQFILERNRLNRMSDRRPADELLSVQMRKGTIATYTHETVRVTGTLRIAPEKGEDGNTWVVYRLEDATVEKIR